MRQAVVIIHGIGEHRPMSTLRAFVAGVLGKPVAELKDCAFSKPDRISDTLELRRLSVPGGKHGGNLLPEKCDTDFYELYWHHLMQGTTWHSVLKWLLYWLRHPEKLNDRLYRIWKRVAAAAGLVALAVVAIVVAAIAWPELRLWELEVAIPVSLLLVAPLVWAVLKWPLVWRVEHIVLGIIGDAARYLSPDPPNVGARRAIRTAGLELLRGLHEDELRRYERIILVGHSLGSVIAYDLITWFWQEQHHRVELKRGSGARQTLLTYPIDPPPGCQDRSPLEDLPKPAKHNLETFRAAQWKLGQELRDKGLPWLITDLVTLASPLAHAEVLLADGKDDLNIAKSQREFPTCPPSSEDDRDDGLLWRHLRETPDSPIRILHHGAAFAVTRWTNLYFVGDVIGGGLKDLLGPGIKDVPLSDDEIARRWRSHTRYWDLCAEEACRKLREALQLEAS